MAKESIRCLFCQTLNDFDDNVNETKFDKSTDNATHHTQAKTKSRTCHNCGMLLSNKNPEGSSARRKRWLPFFWFVVIFCVVMMIYLPR